MIFEKIFTMTTAKNIFHITLALTGIALIATSAAAQQKAAEAPYNGPVYMPPEEGARPPLEPKLKVIPGDGADIRQYRLVSEFFSFIMGEPRNWAVRNDGRSSISYQLRWDPSVHFTISIYLKNEFLPDVSEKSIKGYIEGLKRKHKKNITVLNDDGSYLPQNQNTNPLDEFDNKMLIYTVTDPKTGTTTKHYENFLLHDGKLVVAELSGPQGAVEEQPMEMFTRYFWVTYPIAEGEG